MTTRPPGESAWRRASATRSTPWCTVDASCSKPRFLERRRESWPTFKNQMNQTATEADRSTSSTPSTTPDDPNASAMGSRGRWGLGVGSTIGVFCCQSAGSAAEHHVDAAILFPACLIGTRRVHLAARGGRHFARRESRIHDGVLHVVRAPPAEHHVVLLVAARIGMAHEAHGAAL